LISSQVQVRIQLNSPAAHCGCFDSFGRFQNSRALHTSKVVAHFYDADPTKISRLKDRIRSAGQIDRVEFVIESLTFQQALQKNREVLRSRSAAKLLLIDQFGVEHVTDSVFRELVTAPTCDFLFFLSSWTLHRFRDHPAIQQKITRPTDHYHVHRAAVDYYRSLLSESSAYYLAPFSIRKESGIYGIIFGSAHPLGMDKCLEVAWKKDEISGEADFDIHRDNIRVDQPKLDFGAPTKLRAFERELDDLVRKKAVKTERDVIRVCFRHGVKRQHAEPVLAALKKEGVIRISWRVPDIRKLEEPRLIEFI
jgi:three-Cys-motif partner protein